MRCQADPAWLGAARRLLAVQGALGYIQYFTGLPPLLVGMHVLGAVLIWITALLLFFSLRDRGSIAPAATAEHAAAATAQHAPAATAERALTTAEHAAAATAQHRTHHHGRALYGRPGGGAC